MASLKGDSLDRKATNGLTARPAESEHPGAEINDIQEQQSFAEATKEME
ncbi:hypothetical protein ACSVDE_15280 [Pseudalkalibacillus sp. Hm43]